MAPFRPSNINKRSYPGNANIVGPTVNASLGVSTTTCFSSTPSFAACVGPDNVLGCRYTYCYCPCCNICCSCPETLCTRTVPSGIWKSSEQYEARERDAWGDNTCSCGAATCLCCTDVGSSCFSATCSDCKSFFICCGPSTTKWFVVPYANQKCENWACNVPDSTAWCSVACNNTDLGSCGWFVPDIGQLQNPGYCARTYWDNYCCAFYWSSSGDNVNDIPAFGVHFNTGCSTRHGGCRKSWSNPQNTRAFRCTAS